MIKGRVERTEQDGKKGFLAIFGNRQRFYSIAQWGEFAEGLAQACINIWGGGAASKLGLPPTEESLKLLPIFSLRQLGGITAKDLHEGFQVDVKLEEISLSVSTTSVLVRRGYKTIGEIILIPGDVLLPEKNFGRECLAEVQANIRKIVLQRTNHLEGGAGELDFSSYAAMVDSFTRHCLEKKSQELVSRRLCFEKEKLPTLEQLGEQFSITRERAQQILKKGYAILKIKTNLDLLEGFKKNIDHIVKSGGGIINLRDLSIALQDKYEWSRPPNPIALGQLLSLLSQNQTFAGKDDLIKIECRCLICDKPIENFLSLDLDEYESFNVKLLAKILSENCQKICHFNTGITLSQSYIERLVKSTNGKYVIHDEIIMTRDKWLSRHCVNLEEIIAAVLERNGKPMHFDEIASFVQSENLKHRNISSHNVRSALMRYDKFEIISRGIYGLKSWGMGGYRSVSPAIEEILDASNRPLNKSQIIQMLSDDYSKPDIIAALGTDTRFAQIGVELYDLWERQRQCTCQGLIDQPLDEYPTPTMSQQETVIDVTFGDDENAASPSISIRKKDRGKIRL